MNIAIVGPSPCPYTIGGAENLLWGLLQEINQNTSHKAELIKLPSREHNFWELIATYQDFWRLDLSHFDLVISTKYPSWMTRHHNQICYLVHRLRGLYDTYHFTGLSCEVDREHPLITKVLDYIQDGQDLEPGKLFELLAELNRQKDNLPDRYFNFPGPLIRKIIHALDNAAFQPGKLKGYFAISKNVINRDGYFPPGVRAQHVYPPSFLPRFRTGSYDYLFTVSRLDNPKRIDLMIQAMLYVKAPVRLKIAGTGPEEGRLRKLAVQDERIEFLGFVNDAELVDLYADALAVLYLPYDEDYGLVTIEAMQSRKPVITCIDSGGTNEFVQNGQTGFSVEPDPQKIAEKIEFLLNNTGEAKQMGDNGYQAVKDITWQNTIAQLLSKPSQQKKPGNFNKSGAGSAGKPKIVLTSTFPVYPPLGGGQLRTYNLFKYIAQSFAVEVVSFTNAGQVGIREEIAPGLTEVQVPKSEEHQLKESEIECKLGIPITDVVMPRIAHLTPHYRKALRQSLSNADLAVASHPYLLQEILACTPEIPVVYDAQDIEFLLKKQVLPDNKEGQKLLQEIYQIEKKVCLESILIFTCSEEDKNQLADIYNVSQEKILVVPNGVDIKTVPFVSSEERIRAKNQIGLKTPLVIFVGSWHPPNLEAAEQVFLMAEKLPHICFGLMGSQCLAFTNKKLPGNVGLFGVVDNELKDFIFSIADLAINPMLSGSGTNLKMLDYMAGGIPVISTPFGARGLQVKDDEEIVICGIENIPEAIQELLADPGKRARMVKVARATVEQRFDWEKIGKAAGNFLKNVM